MKTLVRFDVANAGGAVWGAIMSLDMEPGDEVLPKLKQANGAGDYSAIKIIATEQDVKNVGGGNPMFWSIGRSFVGENAHDFGMVYGGEKEAAAAAQPFANQLGKSVTVVPLPRIGYTICVEPD